MSKIQLLQALIDVTTDEAKLKELSAELQKAIREDEREKIAAEEAAKATKTAEELASKEFKEKRETSKDISTETYMPINKTTRFEVGVGMYRGFSMAKAMDAAKLAFRSSGNLRKGIARMEARPAEFEGVVKVFTDLYLMNAGATPNRVKAAMQEGTPSEGGYITPTEERMEVLAYIRETSVALEDCRHVPMTTDSMTLPRELTKVSVAYTDEESEATETEPTFDEVELTAKRMDAYSVTSNELLQDTGIPGGIIGLLFAQFVEAIGQKVDSTVFMGTGSPFSGVFLYAGYSQVFASGSTNFSALLESDLRALIAKIPTKRRGNAKWYGNRSPVWTYLYGLEDNDGRKLFIPSMNEKVPDRFYGYPLREVEQAPSVSAAGRGMFVFGDLTGVMIGDRLTNISLFVDPFTRSTKYQTLFLMFTRWAYAHALPNNYGRIVTAAA